MSELKDMIPILRSLGISPERLGPEKMEKLQSLAESISDPSQMNEESAIAIMRELGIGLGAPKETRKKPVQKMGRNEKCHCNSDKKYKNCCGKA